MSLRKFAWFSKNRDTAPNSSKNLNENQTIRFCVSENPNVEVSSSHVQKFGILLLFARKMITDACLF